jgi:two-component system sensor kinase
LTEAYGKGQHLPHREELAVESLTQAEATQLALMLLGRDDDASRTFANKIAAESGGWPFFVWELAQHVQEDPEIADQSLELDEVIWTRVNRLPKEARRLLELIAVSGRPIPTMEAYRAIDAVEKGQGHLAQLRTSNFVRTTESEDAETVVETYHDRVRESVVDHLDQDTLKQHNLQLALTIEAVSGIQVADLWAHINSSTDWEEPTEPYQLEKRAWQRVFDLASFFDAAGEDERAFPFALTAAEQARKQNALEVAEQQFCIARAGASKQSDAIRFRVLEGLGSVLTLRGRYGDARTQFEAALALTQSAVPVARVEGKLGALAFKQGDLGTAGEYTEKALIALGERPPRNYPSTVAFVCKEATVQVLHTFFPSLVGKRDVDTDAGRMDLLRARLFDAFTMVCWYTRGVELCLWSHLRVMNISERYPPSAEMAKAYSFHSIVMSGLPMANRGIKYARRSHDIFKDRGDLWGQGQALSFHTFSYFVLGQPEKAIETSSRAVELLEQAGDVWEANMARMMNTWALYHAGDLKSAFRQNNRVLSIAKEVGDYSGMAIALCFWMQIDPKSSPQDEMQAEVDRPREDATSRALAIQGRGLEILFREDDPQRAAQVLQESLDLCKSKGVRNVCVFASATWKVTALRIAAEREPEGPARLRAIGQANKAARAALKITKQYLTCRAHLLRECGSLAVLAGREQQARQYFDESIELAEAQGARREHAKSMLARGEAGLKVGWPDAAQDVANARPLVEQMENLQED